MTAKTPKRYAAEIIKQLRKQKGLPKNATVGVAVETLEKGEKIVQLVKDGYFPAKFYKFNIVIVDMEAQ